MANKTSIHHDFKLQPSRLKYIIHSIAWLSFNAMLYALLPLHIWIFFILISLVLSLHFFWKEPKILYLGYLAEHEWTLIEQQKQKSITQHYQIINMIDHILYIVVYFHPQHQRPPIIIWQDQVNELTWKGLKTRAFLRNFK